LLGQYGIDGKFTTSTQNAVKKFQQDNRLPVDGKVGPITWGALCVIIPNSFIVELKSPGPSPLSTLSPGSLREIIGSLTPQIAAAGGRIGAVYDQFGMFNVVFERPLANPEQFINSLRAHPAVQRVFHDAIVTATQLPPPQPQQQVPTGIDRVDADLSATRSGDGVGSVDADIAVLDTGVFTHADLNLYRCISFLNSDYLRPVVLNPNACPDLGGHGTHVAGIAAAKDNNIGVVGTAPGARIWALQVLHPGACQCSDDSDVLEGLEYVAEHFQEIEVANLSLGRIGINGDFDRAINKLVLLGVVVVVAAGNENIDANSDTPGGYPYAITVSAITDSDGKCGGAGPAMTPAGVTNQFQQQPVSNPDDFFAAYSNYGSVIDLAAPGSGILSTINKTGGYNFYSGTSMAAPHVAGAAALIKSLHPKASAFQIDLFLKSIGTKAPAAGNPLLPCDGAGRGYFDDRYYALRKIVFTDKVKEPLLHMGAIR
jgi:subtilisin